MRIRVAHQGGVMAALSCHLKGGDSRFLIVGAALALLPSAAAAQVACGTPTSAEETVYFLGSTPGRVEVTYDMFGAPDRLDIIYGESTVATTGGLVSDTTGSPLIFTYSPVGGDFTVLADVTPGSLGSAWIVTVGCPGGGATDTAAEVATASAVTNSQTVAVQQIAQTQIRNFSRRLEALRHATRTGRPRGGRISLSGLTVNYGGASLSPSFLGDGDGSFAERLAAGLAGFAPATSPSSFADERTGREYFQQGFGSLDRGILRSRQLRAQTQEWRDQWMRHAMADKQVAQVTSEEELLPDRLGFFVNGIINFGDRDATGTASGFEFHNLGISFGADYRVTADLVLGAGGGINAGRTDITGGSKSDVNAYNITGYGSWRPLEAVYLDGQVSITILDFDLERAIGTTPVRARADREGRQFSASLTGGYEFTSAGATYGPYLRLSASQTRLDPFTETDAGASNLTFEDEQLTSATTALGFRADYAISTTAGILSPYLRAEYEHEFRGENNPAIVRFAGVPGSETALGRSRVDRNFFNLGAGASFLLENAVSLFVDFETLAGFKDQTSHLITAGVSARF